MNVFSTTDLLETFNDLGINTGNVNKLTIDSWYDTDCEATKELLSWLCTHLSKDNVLTASENEIYQELLANHSLLTGKQYEVALSQVKTTCPGVFDYDKNVFEVESIEEQLATLLDEERELEHLLNFNMHLSKKLLKEINKASEEELTSNIQTKAAQEKCLELSCKLDETHEKLQLQISRYAGHLNEFDYSSQPSFLSNVCTKKYDQYYMDVVSHVGLLTRQNYEVLPTVRTAKKKLLQDSNLDRDFALDELEVLRQRISNSVQNYLLVQVTEETLRAEIQFLESLNSGDILSVAVLDDSFQLALEAKVFSKGELLKQACFNLREVAKQMAGRFMDSPKISCIKNTTLLNHKKLQYLTQIDAKFTEILAKHLLLCLLLEKEKGDVQSTDKFFRDVHYYITHTLHSSQSRTEAMTKAINDYYVYKNIPLEQQFKLLGIVKALLINNVDENLNNASAIDIINNFNNEYSQIEQQVFVNDYEDHRHFSQQIEQQIEVILKFLVCGPSNQMIIIPQQLIDHFNQINELLETQASMLKFSVQLLNDTQKRLCESKWLKMRRQLWMWFVLEPKKVLLAISQIEMAVKQKHNEAANS